MKNVTFLLPAYNEEYSIGVLIENIQTIYPNSHIIVIDNNSHDKTFEIASKLDVEIIHEKIQGKSQAIQKGFRHLKTPYAVMLDADNTYDPQDASKLLEPLINGECDLVLGSRLNGRIENGAIKKLNIVGNHILSITATILYTKISDVCTGYWAFDKKVVDYLLEVGFESSGFEVEAEMFAKASKNQFKILEIPISYRKRVDKPKLNSFVDGKNIFKTLWIHRFKR
jgi:glycosyltransferase involved in cell wall biosynthesis